LRAVTAATAAAILELDQKSFDNLVLRLGSQALPPGRQGVERRIPVALLEDLMLTRDLHQALGIPSREAFAVARRLLGRSDDAVGNLTPDAEFVGSLQAGTFVHVGADVRALREHVQARLEAAVEIVVRRPRGRPARTSRGDTGTMLGDA
jgi:hypothetical protein